MACRWFLCFKPPSLTSPGCFGSTEPHYFLLVTNTTNCVTIGMKSRSWACSSRPFICSLIFYIYNYHLWRYDSPLTLTCLPYRAYRAGIFHFHAEMPSQHFTAPNKPIPFQRFINIIQPLHLPVPLSSLHTISCVDLSASPPPIRTWWNCHGRSIRPCW